MGRGRAKAKQTKVARKLKYQTGGTDLSQLAQELGASDGGTDTVPERADDAGDVDDDLVSKYADYGENPNRSAH